MVEEIWECTLCNKKISEDDCYDTPDDIDIYCKDCFKKLNGDKLFCGDCGEFKTESMMWSDYTCKQCAGQLGLNTDEIYYEVFESKYDETETLESFDALDEALGFLFTLRETHTKQQFYADKWIGHGLNAQVEDIYGEIIEEEE